jgi:hypothetical protein
MLQGRGALVLAALRIALGALHTAAPPPQSALPFDPRHHFDTRCPGAVEFDPAGQQRDPASTSSYLLNQMAPGANATAAACAELCCHDWSCEAFTFTPSFGGGGHVAYVVVGAEPPPAGSCAPGAPCCTFRDDVDALVRNGANASFDPRALSGVRAKLPATAPPYPPSALLSATLEPHFQVGINGDEFPITWGADGDQYTGAGDNHQAGTGAAAAASPLSFFKVHGGPTEMGCDNPPVTPSDHQPAPNCSNVTEQGSPIPVQGPAVSEACPVWRPGVPNLKSSGVLSVGGVIYWAVSCFNYGDDPVFNRQRYGPAWIITSTDGGVTFNLTATPTDMFPGRLSAPRFVQYGRDYAGAPAAEGGHDWVYVYFPGTTDGAAFFENNDQMLLGRVDKRSILQRGAYQFYMGANPDGTVGWTSDATVAVPVWSFPLMTSVQQANYHPTLQRYVFANWAWISYDGMPRPDHTVDERNARTGHQRTQLTLVEGETPWGPWKVFYRDDDWGGWDGSSGGYTPVFPPAWLEDGGLWMVFTQCCGNPRPPLNHYNFNAQHVVFGPPPKKQ